MIDADDKWTIIKDNKKVRQLSSRSINDISGLNFQINRPNDSIINTDESNRFFLPNQSDENSEDEHEKIDILENPLFWNKCSLIGDIEITVKEILTKYDIAPIGSVMKFDNALKQVFDKIPVEDFHNDFDKVADGLYRKAIFVSVIPRFTPREYGTGKKIYFIHIRFDNYLLAEWNIKSPSDTYLKGFKKYLGFLGENHTHIPITIDSKYVQDNMDNFDSVMGFLKDKKSFDKFQPNYVPSKESNFYERKRNSSSQKNPYYSTYNEVIKNNSNNEEIHKCKLFLEDGHSGYGEILEGNAKEKKIFLHNRKNCSQAFNGDTVFIKVFKEENNSISKTLNGNGNPKTGQVISIYSSDVQPVNKIFLCHLITGTTNLMKPICHTIPVIYVDNKPAADRVKKEYNNLKEGLKDVIGIENIIQTKVSLEKAKYFANKSFVTLKRLDYNLNTIVNKIYYVDCYSCDFIFLVLYRFWDDYSRFPFGEVVGLYTPDVSFGNTLNLIKVACDIPTVAVDVDCLKPKMEKTKRMLERVKEVNQKAKKVFSLKYPNKPFNEIAFSYERKSINEFIVGVHVSNVSSFCARGDYLDTNAQKRYFTFLLPNVGKDLNKAKPDYLFSKEITNDLLSINNEVLVDVFSFYFSVDSNTYEIFHNDTIAKEKIALDIEIDVNTTDNIIKQDLTEDYYFVMVFRFCQFHRTQRLGHVIPAECFFPNFKLRFDQTAYIIDDELRFLANKKASIIMPNFKYIDQEQIKKWYNEASSNCNTLLAPTLLSKLVDLDRDYVNKKKKLPYKFTKQFLDIVTKHQKINLFKCESLFPEIGFYHNNWKSLTKKNIANSYVLGGAKIISVTNPLSCYLDLTAQRLLGVSEVDIESIKDCYREYENHKLSFNKYLKICNSYEIRHKFNSSSFMLDCVFDTFTDDKIFFHHSLLDESNYKNFIPFLYLHLDKQPIERLSNGDKNLNFVWKTKMFKINVSSKPTITGNVVLEDIYNFQSKVWRPDIISSDIIKGDVVEMKKILDENAYKDDLTSEIIKTIDPLIKLKYRINDRQVLRIQFTYDYSSGIMEIIPELLIVNPHLRFCLCHITDPFKFFLHPKELSKINYKRFDNIYEYKSQFIILNRIEGIYQTIITEDSFFIHDVSIDWISMFNSEAEISVSTEEDIYGIVVVDEIWASSRFLHLIHDKTNIRDPVNALRNAINQNKMDYVVCVQSFINDKNAFWIGHCRVADICLLEDDEEVESVSDLENGEKNQKKNRKIHITMKLVHSSFPMKQFKKQVYSMEFMPTPISSRIFERSIKKLQKSSFAENIVMGNHAKNNATESQEVDYKKIRDSMVRACDLCEAQMEALYKSINLKFSLIWGPPGTGKTFIGCIIAFLYVQNNRKKKEPSTVLYCGPSNQSVDVVAEKLLKSFATNKCPKLLRIFNSEIMNYDFPYAGARHRPGLNGCPKYLKSIALHHIIREPGKPHVEKLKEYEEIFRNNTSRDHMEREDFSKLLKQYETLLKKAFKQEIQEGNYEIVLSTAASSCKKLIAYFNVTQVILDECGMCSEPEAIGPFLNKNNLLHVVLIGDHKQLRPIVTSFVAKSKQLDISLFERLYKSYAEYCTMLDTQYRMHPSICEFPSIYFYKKPDRSVVSYRQIYLKTAICESWTGVPDHKVKDNKEFNGLQNLNKYNKDLIQNNVNIANDIWKKGGQRKVEFQCYKHYDLKGPLVYEKILFINTIGTEINQEISCSTGSNQSKSNSAEAEVVKCLYSKLIKQIRPSDKASQSILVITQYRLQEHNLKKICEKILAQQNIQGSPRVSTVVKSQGSESDYVIFSAVRSLPNVQDIDVNPTPGWISKYLGFITDENQFNVAITRAKKGLFVIGNSHLLSVDHTWRDFIDDLKKRKCFIDDVIKLNLPDVK